MEKDKWRYADEIEANGKSPLEPKHINAESFSLPVLTVDIGETDEEKTGSLEVDHLVTDFLNSNPELSEKIQTEKLDIVAHKTSKKDGKTKWALIIGFGFAAMGLGIAGYKLIHKYRKEIDISIKPKK